jgi:hypothetical protein
MKFYLSGPMSGIPESNFPAFQEAAHRLREMGYEVISPAEINSEQGLPWETYLKADIKGLCDCDAVALLPGWENSKGAHLEMHIAHRCGMKIMRIEDIKCA